MPVLTVRQAAERLGVGYSTLKQWIYKGRVRTTRTEGGHHRIADTEVERLLALEGHPPGDSSSVGDFNFLATVAPTAILGPQGGNLHAPEEWVALASVRRIYELYLRFLRDG